MSVTAAEGGCGPESCTHNSMGGFIYSPGLNDAKFAKGQRAARCNRMLEHELSMHARCHDDHRCTQVVTVIIDDAERAYGMTDGCSMR